MKRPSFQFYPGDWLQDFGLRTVSVGARGLWIDMLCYMHQGSDYGWLKVNGMVILPPNLARMVGATIDEVEGWLEELSKAGVYAIDENGCIHSKRMIRDEQVRAARAAGGKLGGNPNLKRSKGAVEVESKDNLPANLEPTPSSPSSSSSSKTEKHKAPPAGDAGLFPGVDAQVVADFTKLRKQKRAPITKTAMDKIVVEAGKAGITLDAALRICCSRGWQGFEAEWVQRGDERRAGPRGTPDRRDSRHSGFEALDYTEGVSDDGRF